ncbi:flavin reductase family protein [Prauserella halophila]|uniref:Flavin reductase family protein n=2 Tax=Prauserella halophila TaxID=185641 RepID=A0ABP4H3V5_9PSEU|nr:NADH-FMN oxidoreductase RutF, flavin reductase (DIM6/NTAB) family [Prauserella halophila]
MGMQSVSQLDEREIRTTFGSFPTGVTALCTQGPSGPDGMAASAFTGVSLEPPLVSVCVQKSSTTWPRLRSRHKLGVSILASGQEAACRSLSARSGDRFVNLAWTASETGAVFLNGAVAWLDCRMHAELDAGDHVIVLLEIERLETTADTAPLVFHRSRFRSLLEPERAA